MCCSGVDYVARTHHSSVGVRERRYMYGVGLRCECGWVVMSALYITCVRSDGREGVMGGRGFGVYSYSS